MLVAQLVEEGVKAYVRGQLGRMLFSGSDVEKKVTTLSGGEAARVIFARIAVQKPNILILDEPTNHLDLEAIDALAASLASFEGTLLFVSHDRWFVSQIANRIIELKPDGLHDFSGSYDEYLARDGADHLDSEAVSLKAKAEKAKLKEVVAQTAAEPEISYEERKRRANRLKALPKKRDTLLAQIDSLEAEKTGIHARYADPNFFTDTPEAERKAVEKRAANLEAQLAGAIEEWESVESELAELESAS